MLLFGSHLCSKWREDSHTHTYIDMDRDISIDISIYKYISICARIFSGICAQFKKVKIEAK